VTAATSLAAYDALIANKRLSPARARAWAHLINHGPCTKGEVNQALGRNVGNPSYHRRVDELVHMGLAQWAGNRKCRFSGFEAETFTALIPDDVDAVPMPLKNNSTRPGREVIKRAIVSMETAFAMALRMNVAPGDDTARVMSWLKRLAGTNT